MRRAILASLSSFLVISCGAPQADKPDLGATVPKCPPSLQTDIPAEPAHSPGAGIVKPPVGSRAAQATEVYLNDVAAQYDWAVAELLPRVKMGKSFCDQLDLWKPGTPWAFAPP
jgi:hypothetical protein